MMEVSGQLHAPATLFLGKEPPSTCWIGWLGYQGRSRCYGGEKNLLHLLGIEPWSSSLQPSHHTDLAILALSFRNMSIKFQDSVNLYYNSCVSHYFVSVSAVQLFMHCIIVRLRHLLYLEPAYSSYSIVIFSSAVYSFSLCFPTVNI
jgi:hypothetical protein